MATKAFHIELRVQNVDDPEKLDAITKSLQEAGRGLLAATVLITGATPAPEIILYGEDFADGRVDVPLGAEEDDAHA